MVLFCLINHSLFSQDITATNPLVSTQTNTPPVIDGELNDAVWQRAPDLDAYFTTYSPVNGDRLTERTRVWIANDTENIYFAFYCHDSRPDQIKYSVTSHDDIWNDDWIGFNLDPLGNKSYGYVLVCNPLGMQADIFDSPVTESDGSPDYVWYSEGKILDDGYTVEIQMPLQNFNYKSGKNVRMNIIFERGITRLGSYASWPAVPVGLTFFAGMSQIVFPHIERQLNLKAIPSITYHNAWKRINPDLWSKGNGRADFGITAKYGITSTLSAEATYNPDFSHIESDAFQVLINQRYPIYYEEKRPFFMETRNSFNLAGGSLEGKNFLSTVHTRNIVDPLWGAKITGEYRRWSFGFLASGDEWPGREFSPDIDGTDHNPFQDRIATYYVGRIKKNIKGENTIGTILTDREFAGGYNRVIGTDLNLRLGDGSHWVRANLLHSHSKDEHTGLKTHGIAGNLAYDYSSRKVLFRADYEYMDRDFNMATAFIRRRGFSKWSGLLGLNFYPNSRFSWMKRVTPMVYGSLLRDLFTKEYDYYYKAAVQSNFVRQGSLGLEYQRFQEFWAGKILGGVCFNTYGQIQLTNWLRIYSRLDLGDRIYYASTNPFMGKGFSTDLQITLQPNEKIIQTLQHQYQDLYQKDNDSKVYDVDIFISKTIYQWSRYLFFRAIVQYDSYLETLLIDALVSYELVPGTVLQIGYGSLHNELYWADNAWNNAHPLGKYMHTDQSVFVKMSYLFQV
jgi:hypothetical protein